MCMVLALTVWNERIAPVFDYAGTVMLTELRDWAYGERRFISLPKTQAAEKVAVLERAGVEVLLCGAISREALELVARDGIEVRPFAAGPVEEVLQGWLEGRLEDERFSLPGCPRAGRRCRRGFGRGRFGRNG